MAAEGDIPGTKSPLLGHDISNNILHINYNNKQM